MENFTIESLTEVMTEHCNLPEGNYGLRDAKVSLAAFLALGSLEQQKIVNDTNAEISNIVSKAFEIAVKNVVENTDLR